jgi:hypothetical protein
MNNYNIKSRLWMYSIFVVGALLIITDFILPGRVFFDDIIEVRSEHQQYYNAARNSHYSYRVFTSKHNFSVSEDFAQAVQDNRKIKYTVSRIFNEANRYELVGAEIKGKYSLRILTGLIFPILLIITLGIAIKHEKKISTFAFVMKVLLIADLIYLLI